MNTTPRLNAGILSCIVLIIAAFVLSSLADSYTSGPDNERYDTCVSIDLTDAVGTQVWQNVRGWARLSSVAVALTNSLTASTNTISIVRSEGVTEDIAVIEGDGASFRWSALTKNDVILRSGDNVQVTMTETNSGGGQLYINLDL